MHISYDESSVLELVRLFDSYIRCQKCAEDLFIVVMRAIRVVSRLWRLAFLHITDPALPGWANVSRAYGAGGSRGREQNVRLSRFIGQMFVSGAKGHDDG